MKIEVEYFPFLKEKNCHRRVRTYDHEIDYRPTYRLSYQRLMARDAQKHIIFCERDLFALFFNLWITQKLSSKAFSSRVFHLLDSLEVIQWNFFAWVPLSKFLENTQQKIQWFDNQFFSITLFPEKVNLLLRKKNNQVLTQR